MSSSSVYASNIESLVNHGTGYYYTSSDGSSAYIQISFLKGYIFPTGYTLKGTTGCLTYAKSWYVYGIHEWDENIENRWEILGENDSSESTYCQPPTTYIVGCLNDSVGSFTLKPMKSSCGFKHLRWKLKEVCDSCFGIYFLTAGIDVYGTYSLSRFLETKTKGNRKFFCCCFIWKLHFILLTSWLALKCEH